VAPLKLPGDTQKFLELMAFPRLKKRGSIEAISKSVSVVSEARPFPRLKKRGSIEASQFVAEYGQFKPHFHV